MRLEPPSHLGPSVPQSLSPPFRAEGGAEARPGPSDDQAQTWSSPGMQPAYRQPLPVLWPPPALGLHRRKFARVLCFWQAKAGG